jgi:hypothetical protein
MAINSTVDRHQNRSESRPTLTALAVTLVIVEALAVPQVL